MNAIGKKKRGVWIGVYVLVEIFAFVAYLMAGALIMTGREGAASPEGTAWLVVRIVLGLLFVAAEIGYALIWRMAVMYRDIRHRTFWIVLNIVGWVFRMNMILIFVGVITETWISAVPEPLSFLLNFLSDLPLTGFLYVVLVWHDIVIWLNEPKEDRREAKFRQRRGIS